MLWVQEHQVAQFLGTGSQSAGSGELYVLCDIITLNLAEMMQQK